MAKTLKEHLQEKIPGEYINGFSQFADTSFIMTGVSKEMGETISSEVITYYESQGSELIQELPQTESLIFEGRKKKILVTITYVPLRETGAIHISYFPKKVESTLH